MQKLYLSRTDRKLLGLCGGIGQMLDIDSTLIRLAFVFLTLSTGVIPLLFTYFIAWIIIPEQPDSPTQ